MTDRRELAARRPHEVFNFFYAGIEHTLGVGLYQDGTIAEVFIDTLKHGTAVAANAKDAALVLSIAIQYGTPLIVIDHALNRSKEGDGLGVLGEAFTVLRAHYPAQFALESPTPAVSPSSLDETREKAQRRYDSGNAKRQGYTGESCRSCGQYRMKRTGTCVICEDCHASSGCS